MEDQLVKWGRRIRAYRKLKGYTQEQLALKLHVSVSVIGGIERGRKLPSQQLLEDIARVLRVKIEELKGEIEGVNQHGHKKA
ncbi:helix-turn-helix domain-containing protein [Bacillus horti]|uniref:Transcriptional regulator with XRE-family HTH domain n=1 Tax=Caldalkalibacillus horti TaxID=77523 RepID=A0ABT9W2Z7_9BACI|nr:helix-turn-helix transcriptional regulator [Bacillus horti]MDQ0167617.1 transcriptional regulator with XRE-family HTH domain [Bacillus horti]